MPYVIVFKCRGCGGILEVGGEVERVRGGGGRHPHILASRSVYKVYDGVCPYCGRELDLKPERLEFGRLREHPEYLNVKTKRWVRTLTCKVPILIDEMVERLVKEGVYKTKAQFIRKAILKLLKEHGVKPW
jgi:hypothetical protein